MTSAKQIIFFATKNHLPLSAGKELIKMRAQQEEDRQDTGQRRQNVDEMGADNIWKVNSKMWQRADKADTTWFR